MPRASRSPRMLGEVLGRFRGLEGKAALATNLLGIVAHLDVLHRQSVAILVAGSPHHNATRSSGCHAKYFDLWPATHRVIDLP